MVPIPGLRPTGICNLLHRREVATPVLVSLLAWLQSQDSALATSESTASSTISLDTFKSRIARLVGDVSVFSVTDKTGAPVLERPESSKGQKLGHAYFDEAEASSALRRVVADAGSQAASQFEVRTLALADVFVPLVMLGTVEELGGQFRLEAAGRELRSAEKMLGVETLGPPGQVPLFFCPSLEVERYGDKADGASGGRTGGDRVPAFLREADMREALRRANLQGDEAEIVVTTLQRVAEDLGRPDPSDAASKLLAVGNLAEIGLGTWR
eukprot:TRINITY_DN61924_c0_g1_i1.p1 TRINITY_DN61924_c0_g1~~TRINITY_DN61924_c0_g1_i1.p1  ORF type:complete len:279 (+),score=62.37 TRINITY_DN61924_c0_g1_i1:29-838(+)